MIRILFVDDEDEFRKQVADLLRRHGLDVQEAGSGTDALARLKAGASFDLILTDLLMPDTADGPYRIVERIRELTHLPIIVLTGHELTQSAEIVLGKTDADDYQAKQFPQVEHATKEVNIGELVARIIKRTRAAAVYDFPETDDDPSAGFWRLNTQTLELKKPDGSVETLQPAVHTLLQTFLRNPGKRLDQQDLRMEKPNLGNAVWKLRGIIGEDKIVTIGSTYRFARTVRAV